MIEATGGRSVTVAVRGGGGAPALPLLLASLAGMSAVAAVFVACRVLPHARIRRTPSGTAFRLVLRDGDTVSSEDLDALPVLTYSAPGPGGAPKPAPPSTGRPSAGPAADPLRAGDPGSDGTGPGGREGPPGGARRGATAGARRESPSGRSDQSALPLRLRGGGAPASGSASGSRADTAGATGGARGGAPGAGMRRSASSCALPATGSAGARSPARPSTPSCDLEEHTSFGRHPWQLTLADLSPPRCAGGGTSPPADSGASASAGWASDGGSAQPRGGPSPSPASQAIALGGSTGTLCTVCLEDYAEGDALRLLPCGHLFHAACVDQWLRRRHVECPVCKRDVRASGKESPVSTAAAALNTALRAIRWAASRCACLPLPRGRPPGDPVPAAASPGAEPLLAPDAS